MRKLSLALLAVVALALPSVAKAGFVLEASLGKGASVKPEFSVNQPTNILIAPGYGLGEMIRADLGFVFDMPKDGSALNLRLRPMLVIDPPILPIYGRLIVGMANVLEGNRSFEFGGAVGVGGSLLGIGLYGEAGLLPQASDAGFTWLVEGRLGAYYAF